MKPLRFYFRLVRSLVSWLALALIFSGSLARAADTFIVLQSTTSTENSGLFDHILPLFEKSSGIEVRVVAVGTGQAIRNASEGNGDALLVHAKASEELFVSQGHGVERLDVMFNDFVIVGPPEDPAGIAGSKDAVASLKAIAGSGARFASRGDDSGTNKAELRLWAETGVDAQAASGGWYRETGSGMGATLNIAREMGAYTLTDRATWISFGRKGTHQIMTQGDPEMFNQYGVIAVNSARHPNAKFAAAQAFVDWIVGEEGQAAINGYRVNDRQVFFPNAR